MNLADLKLRGGREAKRLSLTFAAFVGDHGVPKRTLDRTLAGRSQLDVVSAIRLLPLVERLLLPGEVCALELSTASPFPVAICPAALLAELAALRREIAALRAASFHHQPN